MGKKPVPTLFDLRLIAGRDSSDNPRQVRVAAITGVADQGYLPVILIGQDPSGDPVSIACDAEGRLMGAYEGDLTVTMGDVEKLLAEAYWLNTKLFYDASDNCIYKCCNNDLSAADGDTDWYVTKYDWTGGNCTQIRMRITSVTNRTAGW